MPLPDAYGGPTPPPEGSVFARHSPHPEILDTASPPLHNPRGRIARQYDASGLVETIDVDFKGNIVKSRRQLAATWQIAPDWSDLSEETTESGWETEGALLLESADYVSTATFDAVDRPVTMTTPAESGRPASTHRYGYDRGGRLAQTWVTVRGGTEQPVVTEITYNARGQRRTFVYDATGNRVRKVSEHRMDSESPWARAADTVYLGGFELARKWTGAGGDDVDEEIETVHLMDGESRIALIETQTVEDEDPVRTPTPKWRFRLDDRLGSACIEIARDGTVISYEEYHAYGSTALHIADASFSPRRYRWSGKERDPESGLVYFGARYLVPWMGRWVSADPAGAVDGNPYRVVRGNPVSLREVDGRESIPDRLSIHFPVGSSTISDSDAERVASWAGSQPAGTSYVVVGTASRTGSASLNEELGASRAFAAAGLLEERGVDPGLIAGGSYGERLAAQLGERDGVENPVFRAAYLYASRPASPLIDVPVSSAAEQTAGVVAPQADTASPRAPWSDDPDDRRLQCSGVAAGRTEHGDAFFHMQVSAGAAGVQAHTGLEFQAGMYNQISADLASVEGTLGPATLRLTTPNASAGAGLRSVDGGMMYGFHAGAELLGAGARIQAPSGPGVSLGYGVGVGGALYIGVKDMNSDGRHELRIDLDAQFLWKGSVTGLTIPLP